MVVLNLFFPLYYRLILLYAVYSFFLSLDGVVWLGGGG